MAYGPVDCGTVGPAAGMDTGLPTDPSRGVFGQITAVADAVLYEGYLLYPYRRSSAKNRVRWQFGVLFPRPWVEADGPVVPGVSGSADSWYQRTEVLLRVRRPGATVRVRLRHLQTQHKQIEQAGPHGGHRPVPSLRTDDGTVHLTFDEAVPREADIVVPLEDLLRGERTVPVEAAAGEDVEPLPGRAGRVVRRREEVRASVTLTAERLADDAFRLRVRTANTVGALEPRAPRDEALRRALVATHTLIGGDGVEFVSLIDPPADLADQARACRNEFTFPVLADEPPAGPVVLSAPIILPDHPQVAPESPGDLHDAAEIDEILTLRTMLLTDEEKREARATDPRAAAILDRVDTMPPEIFARLHGAVRSLTPAAAPAGPPLTTPPAGAALTVVPVGLPPAAASAGPTSAAAPFGPPPAAASAGPAPTAAPAGPAPTAPPAGAALTTPPAGAALTVVPVGLPPAAASAGPTSAAAPFGPPSAAASAGPAPTALSAGLNPAAAPPGGTPAAGPVGPNPAAASAGPTPPPAPAGPAPAAAPVAPPPATPMPPPAATPVASASERPVWWQEGADDGLSPTTETVLVDGVSVGGGSRVRLRPRRSADAQDMFLAGRTAKVAAVFHDVDGSVHLAVTLDDDPASELHTWYGRFLYFRPDELEPLEPATSPDEPSQPAPAAAPARHTTTDSETHRSGGR
ncbi:hypothetical protein [Streptomyces heilongjiangensis]|uniref:Uncharacterized protein n=1 Tax=Streptomyces heilongjiangensis TaxID=945052 RepID=A0ABW1B622_9ACTN